MAFVQKLGMPLHAEEKLFVLGFNGLDDPIRGNSGGEKARGNVFDRLMVRAIDLNGRFAGNAPKQ